MRATILPPRRPVARAPQPLLAAHRAGLHRVDADGQTLELRAGVASAALARLLRRYGVTSAAYLSTCNPYGVRVGAAANRAAHQALRDALVAADAFVFEGLTLDPAGARPAQPAWLALGIALAPARGLAQRFRQNALLFADDEAVPRLLWLPRGEASPSGAPNGAHAGLTPSRSPGS